MPDWLNIFLRSVAALLVLFLLAKLIGKRQIRQLTFIEYVVGITIGSIGAFMATEADGPIHHSLIAMAVFGLFPIAAEWLSLKSKVIRNLFEGNATILIKDGKILEDNMKQERLTTEDLLSHLRAKNIFRLADVEFAVMEPSGELSVLLKAEHQPLTPSQLERQVPPAEEPQAVIMDGVIMDEPLATAGYNRAWLQAELDKAGVALENVFLGQVDNRGELYLDLFDDKLQVQPAQTPKLTYATLKRCQADLELFALATRDQQMKRLYERESKRLQEVVDLVGPLLIR